MGKRIANIRKQKGLTQWELADKMKIARSLITDYERGKLRLFDEVIVKLAEAFETTTDDVLGYKTQKEPIETNVRIMKRFRKIETLPEMKKKAILKTLDDLIRANK